MNKTRGINEKIYEIIAMAGGINSKAINLLCPTYSYNSKHTQLNRLRKKGLLKTKNGLTYFTNLDVHGNEWLAYTDVLLTNVGKETANETNRSKPTQVQRTKRQSEIVAIMLESGVSLSHKWISDSEANYYITRKSAARELVKEKGEAIRNETFTKEMGTWIKGTKIYHIYYADNKKMVWSVNQEGMYAEMIKQKRRVETEKQITDGSIMYTDDIEKSISELFDADAINRLKSKKKNGHIAENDKYIVTESLISPSSVYKEMLLISRSYDGINLTSLLMIPNIQHKLDLIAVGDSEKATGMVADRVEEENGRSIYHLNLLYPDIARLEKFLGRKKYDINPRNKYVVHCFKEYAKGLAEYDSGIEIIEYDINVVGRDLIEENYAKYRSRVF